MKNKEMYSIGQVEKICKVTKKALRYYDKMNILSPDMVRDDNGYRYYSKQSMLYVPIIKYYKQTGFKLEEMKDLLDGTTYDVCEKTFRNKIDDLKEIQKEVQLKLQSLLDWYQLVIEAQCVLEKNYNEVCMKYIENDRLLYLDQVFEYDYMDSIINTEFTNYVQDTKNAITGPVIIKYDSFGHKINGQCKKARIMQKKLLPCDEEKLVDFGGCMMVSCYHIGDHETINNTYDKILCWIEKHGYECDESSYERYVVDYWTIKNKDKYVTEILIKIKNRKLIK
ncbi:MerR family transcriptional regulator [Sedimentibacter sp. zth1]|uniref:MerR family transcriptional regulator n=1 Tax=Sedimentibacter sp. zth1 TaxID=2816908 RepID=UPI001A9253DD|nr:GyrI-like domain-containing protein [Sedimentibacter sp. zth1]QSX07399.1 MerR family transcriptional regulator [Sedimentibacter sp. zth1]